MVYTQYKTIEPSSLFDPQILVLISYWFIADYGERKKVLPSVSSSLVLAAGLGVAEAVALSVGSGYLVNIMGISVVCGTRYMFLYFLFNSI